MILIYKSGYCAFKTHFISTIPEIMFNYVWLTNMHHIKFINVRQSMWAELSGENFRFPLTWVFAPPAPPLKVAPDRSAQFGSPLTYNFIPLQWNRSTLAQI